jgi:hypothetical protein
MTNPLTVKCGECRVKFVPERDGISIDHFTSNDWFDWAWFDCPSDCATTPLCFLVGLSQPLYGFVQLYGTPRTQPDLPAWALPAFTRTFGFAPGPAPDLPIDEKRRVIRWLSQLRP